MSHTPGPWDYVLHDNDDVPSVTFEIRMGSRIGGRNGWEPQHRIDYEVPDKESSPKQFQEGRSNARLIAAAPDLLAACKALRAEVQSHNDDYYHVTSKERLSSVDAVIAKAEGR